MGLNGRGGPDNRGGAGGGPLSASDRQQFSRELRERQEDAQALRRELSAQGYDVADLDRILDRMRQLAADGTLRDTQTAQRLQASVIEGLKAYEYALRRQIEGTTKEKLFLGGNDDVPEGFRKLVEEYYKSLSSKPPKP
jgi:hypothetical protein